METFGNEISVQQGEDWNLDILLSASQIEYIPYIISNERKNPFFVITVASTKYEKNLRYVCSWWSSVTDGDAPTPLFYQTVPHNVGEYASSAELPSIPPDLGDGTRETKATRLLYQYTLADEEVDLTVGHRPYHYYYFEYDDEGQVKNRVDEYECRIRFNFLSKDTSQWSAQNYLYQITLVSGEELGYVLDKIAKSHGYPDDWPENDIAAQYHYVKVQWPDALQPDIDATSPLGYIESPEVIMSPTKLQVFNNLRQLI